MLCLLSKLSFREEVMATFIPDNFSELTSQFKEVVTTNDISEIVLTCFTYLLIALGKFNKCTYIQLHT